MFATGSKDPVPNAQSLSPSNVTHAASNLLVSIKGANFIPNSQVTWNGSLLFADYVSPNQLNLYVPGREAIGSRNGQCGCYEPRSRGRDLNAADLHH